MQRLTDAQSGLSTAKQLAIVVDGFYTDPDAIRRFALSLAFTADTRYHKGKRSLERYLFPGVKERFERLLDRQITKWSEHGYNGVFQTCIGGDPIVFHSDMQDFAGAVYLTPGAPVEAGTSLYRSRSTWLRRAPTNADASALKRGSVSALGRDTYGIGGSKLLDSTAWERVDSFGNVYNRLVLWDARLIHAASCYFGHSPETSRLVQLFFFDAK